MPFFGAALSGPADLFIQFIDSTVLSSVDIAAQKMSKNVLIQRECWWEVERGARRRREEAIFCLRGWQAAVCFVMCFGGLWSQVAKA